MTGGVTWEQIIFLSGIIVFVVTSLIGAFIWIMSRQEKMHMSNMLQQKETMKEQASLRHDLRSSYDHKMGLLDQRITDESRRIDQIEIFNAGLRILMQTIEKFQDEVKARFTADAKDRKDEIKSIEDKLDEILRDQLRRRRSDTAEPATA